MEFLLNQLMISTNSNAYIKHPLNSNFKFFENNGFYLIALS